MLLVQNQLKLEMLKYHNRSVSWIFLLRGVFEFNSQDMPARELIETDKFKFVIFFYPVYLKNRQKMKSFVQF